MYSGHSTETSWPALLRGQQIIPSHSGIQSPSLQKTGSSRHCWKMHKWEQAPQSEMSPSYLFNVDILCRNVLEDETEGSGNKIDSSLIWLSLLSNSSSEYYNFSLNTPSNEFICRKCHQLLRHGPNETRPSIVCSSIQPCNHRDSRQQDIEWLIINKSPMHSLTWRGSFFPYMESVRIFRKEQKQSRKPFSRLDIFPVLIFTEGFIWLFRKYFFLHRLILNNQIDVLSVFQHSNQTEQWISSSWNQPCG